MGEYNLQLPKLGESIVSAEVVKWLKKEGETVYKDENILEVATDKVNSEIPSPVAGKIKKIVVKEGQEAQVGDILAVIETEGESVVKEEKLSPAVLRMAEERGISKEELLKIQGTGEGGRITRSDLEKHKKGPTGNILQSELKISTLRKALSEHITKAYKEIPHAVLIDEVDVTDHVSYIEKNKRKFFDKYKAKLSITSFMALAIAKAAKKFSLANSSYHQDKILVSEQVNLALAVNVGDNILLPAIEKAEELNLEQTAKKIFEMVSKAKEGKLSLEEVQRGTLTLSNFGMTDVLIGIPIISYPQSAIIAIGAIKKKPSVLENGQIAARDLMMMALSFDHRVFDGIYGCNFLNEIKLNAKLILRDQGPL